MKICTDRRISTLLLGVVMATPLLPSCNAVNTNLDKSGVGTKIYYTEVVCGTCRGLGKRPYAEIQAAIAESKAQRDQRYDKLRFVAYESMSESEREFVRKTDQEHFYEEMDKRKLFRDTPSDFVLCYDCMGTGKRKEKQVLHKRRNRIWYDTSVTR